MKRSAYIEISPVNFDEDHRKSIIMAMRERWPIVYKNSDGTAFAHMLPNDDSEIEEHEQAGLSDEKG